MTTRSQYRVQRNYTGSKVGDFFYDKGVPSRTPGVTMTGLRATYPIDEFPEG
jgi:hypothetical protein